MINVMMFHSVGNTGNNWYRNWLSCDLVQFEKFCAFLARNRYRTVHLDEWYASQSNGGSSEKEFVLTFDDGYLDNLVYAYPIMKKYGLRGTIFINPEFVDPGTEIHPTLEDAEAGKCRKEDLVSMGFLNWNELKLLDESRVLDIQSHSMSHNFYFYSPKIKDIYRGQPKYDWLAWLERPERKPFYLNEDQTDFVPAGYPVFEFDRALGLRRYFPSEEFLQYAVSRHQSGADKAALVADLNKKLEEFPGAYESDEDMEKRYRYELFDSKTITEDKLGKTVEFLCWPGGGYNELSVRLSEEAGYIASTIASRDRDQALDNSGAYKRIKRFGMASFVKTSSGPHLVKASSHLVENFRGRTGSNFHRNITRARKLGFMARDVFKK